MAQNKIVFTCSVCHLPIATQSGYVEYDAWDAAEKPFSSWRALHRGCDPDVMGSTYWIAVERLSTGEDLIRAFEHLSSKQWFSPAEWGTLLDCLTFSAVQ
jgi:hypothetical protein